MLRRAQLTLMLATLIPTVLMTALGIVLLITGSRSVSLVAGALVVAFCATSVTGYILGSMFVSRGASIARIQNDYLSSVSHELRTPLTSMRLFIETLRDNAPLDPAEKQKCLELLHREMHRLEELVNRVLDLSRMEMGRWVFQKQDVAIDAVIQDALSAFAAATIRDPTQVTVTCSPNLMVVGDHVSLAQAVTNLLTNAWKYTDKGARDIRLSASAVGDKYIDLVVSDNGIGIAKREQRLIFNEFERGEAAVRAGASGSGLGLAIVRAIVRAHRGKVEIRSRAGAGSEFRVRLRRLRDGDQVPKRSQTAAQTAA